jgi:hypothetical protein
MAKSKKDQGGKGLPKRASSHHPKHAKRMGHKARADAKTAVRRAEIEAGRLRNIEYRAQGLPTPYEARQANRRRND